MTMLFHPQTIAKSSVHENWSSIAPVR